MNYFEGKSNSSILSSGFHIENAIFSGLECAHYLDSLHKTCSQPAAGTRNSMADFTVAEIALDARMMQIARNFLNSKAMPFRATLFEKSVRTNWLVSWHQDTALPLMERNSLSEWGPWSKKAGILYAKAPSWVLRRVVALRLHLDTTTKQNGALRVVPSSHLSGILSHEEIIHIAKMAEPITCEVEKGGVMSMSPLLIHASSKVIVDQPRRVLHIEYGDSLDLKNIKLAIA
jgi:ectoine hydroxylase-related dioxygenase (phytanoyl-CoA dioxygenase family)